MPDRLDVLVMTLGPYAGTPEIRNAIRDMTRGERAQAHEGVRRVQAHLVTMSSADAWNGEGVSWEVASDLAEDSRTRAQALGMWLENEQAPEGVEG